MKSIQLLIEDHTSRLERLEQQIFAAYGLPRHLIGQMVLEHANAAQHLPLSANGAWLKQQLEKGGEIVEDQRINDIMSNALEAQEFLNQLDHLAAENERLKLENNKLKEQRRPGPNETK